MTRALALAALAAVIVAGCSKTSTTTPSTTPTPAAPTPTTTITNFTAQLSPSNEVPAVTNAESGGSGTVTVKVTLNKDAAGSPTSATVDFNATFSGFPTGTALTAAHIHPGAAGTNGSPLVSTTITSGEVTFPNGSGTLSKTGLTLPVDQATAIDANPAGYYFNIHTALNPGGVARGQLVKQ